ncbi:MAG TPA: M15 family metallopeptidase [Candidatus Onthousia excrementipullorum]|uniref:M15 family metallopeptidase n=1 Tax=Candidatus Onthousia excrementipullorum TaxID=2840884 RepID=A0A9D1J3K5_9FIRM|nr:M15 family metallopeptidase [Candidatus Onthousia excrementipullorum]
MKKKVKIIIVISVLVVVILIIGGIYLNSKRLVLEYEHNIEVDVNEKLYNLDAIKNIKNGKIITKKELVNTTKLGKVKVTFQVENFFKKRVKYKYIVNVVDKEAPKITFKNELESEIGEEIDLLKDVTVEDNSKEKITPQVEGEYDINKSGDYKLYYIAEDTSGNKAKEEFILHIKEKNVEKQITSNDNQGTTSFTTSKGFKGVTKNGVTYIEGYLVVNKTYTLPSSYGNGLTNATTEAFNKMQAAAKVDGLNIYISSGFRSYSYQKTLYNNYVNRDGVAAADTYSARAGHSEHQSGLAFDVNTINDSFANTEEGKWLNDNCYKYGFILRYPNGKGKETGYQYEPWHFRYVGVELAEKLYNNGNWITVEDYFGITSRY